MSISAKIRVLLSVSLIVGLGAGQRATAAPDAAAAPELNEVVVTAQKRSERLQDVPISISVLDASSLADNNQNSIADYFAQVPGLSVNTGSAGRVNIAIRGLTTGGNTNPTVGTTIDDVPIGSSSALTYAAANVPNLDPASLERIEVLRGPQGTLYGAASLGGLLRYVTKAPKFDVFNGVAQIDGTTMTGGGQGYGAHAFANVPLVNDTLAATVSGFYRHDPGYVHNVTTGASDINSADFWGGRVSTLWQIASNVTLRVSALYQKSQGDGTSNVEADSTLHPYNGELSVHNIVGTGTYDRKLQQYDATLAADLGFATLTSITGYGITDWSERFDNSVRFGSLTSAATGRTDLGTMTDQRSETKKVSEEIRLASPTGQEFEWLVGAFLTRESPGTAYNIFGTDLGTGAVVATVFPDSFPLTFKEYAGFVTGTYHFTDQFNVQVGGRYSKNSQVYDELITGPLYDPPYVDHEASADHSFTYLVSPQFRFSPNLMTYVRIASGYRPGGPNPGAIFVHGNSSYKADTTVSFEVGVKADFLDHRLGVDAAAYYIDWKDIQLQQIDAVSQFLYFSNGGKAKTKGLELTLQGAPTATLKITGTMAYVDATLSEPTNGGVIASAGERLPYSAKWTGSLSAEQQFPIAANVTGFIGADLNYVGDRFNFFPATPTLARERLPSYTSLNARFGVVANGWRISAFAQNLTNKLGILNAEPELVAGGSGTYILNVTNPRTVGVSVSKDF